MALRSAVWNQWRTSAPVDFAALFGRSVLNSIRLNDGRCLSYVHHVCAKEDAPNILFVHGFPLDHSMWLGQIPLCDQANLLMVDLAGFGKSDSVPELLTMRTFADDLAELLNRLELNSVIWCGLSMGGYVGWEFLRHCRQYLKAVICCNTRSGADNEVTARARKVAAADVLKTGTTPVADAMKEKLFSLRSLNENSELTNRIHNVMKDTDPATVAAAQLAMAARSDSSDLLANIDMPALVVAGENDSITPSVEMQEMAMQIDESTFVEIAEAGHLAPAEQPDVFNRAVIHWLDQLQM